MGSEGLQESLWSQGAMMARGYFSMEVHTPQRRLIGWQALRETTCDETSQDIATAGKGQIWRVPGGDRSGLLGLGHQCFITFSHQG